MQTSKKQLGLKILSAVVMAVGLSSFVLFKVRSGVHAAAVPPNTVYSFEAEITKLPAGSYNVADGSASAGRELLFATNGTAWRASTIPAGTWIEFRAKANYCNGWPEIGISIDGTKVQQRAVNSTAWTSYGDPVNIAAGNHIVTIAFANDYAQSGCDRNVAVDSVTVKNTAAINTGTAGSICQADDGGIGYSAPDPKSGVVTTGLPSDAPAYYEIGEPSGAYLGKPAKGLMFTIQGGGWHVVGPPAAAAERPEADLWRSEGWRTINVSYSACKLSFHDVVWFYDKAVAKYGSNLPSCAVGGSAGGHLALMLAAARPSLDCAISQDGPTDLTGLQTETAFDPSTGGQQSSGPNWAYYLAAAAFGANQLSAYSPITYAASIHTPVLFGHAANDPFVPYAQATTFSDKLKANTPPTPIQIFVLDKGTTKWVHGYVSDTSLQQFISAEKTLVSSAAANTH